MIATGWPPAARTVPVVGRTAGKLTIAAGLFGLGAVLRAVSMLAETTPITAWDWASTP